MYVWPRNAPSPRTWPRWVATDKGGLAEVQRAKVQTRRWSGHLIAEKRDVCVPVNVGLRADNPHDAALREATRALLTRVSWRLWIDNAIETTGEEENGLTYLVVAIVTRIKQ